ncbi:hypothetical protein yc1106_08279 [Curvularia clavata]|uniref:Uncharacterized protein n=1 Tax=Curvularia clavata TaxID=95742 RepID=A0A9Q8ZFY5_CURCL|nr:hypothetical protein yc1106_08279 [Curvularia clavata]
MFPVALGVDDVLRVDPTTFALEESGVGLDMGVAEPRDADGLYEKGGEVGNSVVEVSEDREGVFAIDVVEATNELETLSDEGVGRGKGRVRLTMTVFVSVSVLVCVSGRPESNMEESSSRSMLELAATAAMAAALSATWAVLTDWRAGVGSAELLSVGITAIGCVFNTSLRLADTRLAVGVTRELAGSDTIGYGATLAVGHSDELVHESHGLDDNGDEIDNLAPDAYGGGIPADVAIKVNDPEHI